MLSGRHGCRPTLAHLSQLSQLYPEDRVSFVGVGSGDHGGVTSLVDEVHPPFAVALDASAGSLQAWDVMLSLRVVPG